MVTGEVKDTLVLGAMRHSDDRNLRWHNQNKADQDTPFSQSSRLGGSAEREQDCRGEWY